MKALVSVVALSVLVAIPATASAQIPVGTRVGTETVPSGYDDGGRRDPFVSLIVTKKTVASSPALMRMGTGLQNLTVSDVTLRGITKVGTRFMAMIEGPDKKSYTVNAQDHLLDGFVKSVDAEGIVLVEQDAAGRGHEVRKALRVAAEVIR
jgi:Tfp pilus assembly protein PilP